MADFRKLIYALAIVALIGCFTVPASAQGFACTSITGTNQITRVEGWAELVGDIVLDCTGGVPNGAGQPVKGANITVNIPGTEITSKVITSTGTALSEATLIMDDIRDPTSSAAADFAGVRPHLICSDSGGPGGLAVCNVISDGNPVDTYDGSEGHPNIFVARPNGTSSVIFNGIPLDPPGTGFHRTIRITNLRVKSNAFPVSPFPEIFAIIQFQGPAAVGLTAVQTTVASVEQGMGSTTVTADNTFLQCEYPTSIDTATADDSDDSMEVESHGWTADVGSSDPMFFNGTPGLAITIKEGFESAFKPRNMSELLGSGGQVLGLCNPFGSPCIGGGDNNSQSNTNIFAYSGDPGCVVDLIASGCPTNNPSDIAQNSPAIRYFAEGGFSETFADGSLPSGGGYTTGGNFDYSQCTGSGSPLVCKGAGFADYGTRIQFTISNQPTGAIVSLPTVVALMNGDIISGVAVMTSVVGTGKGSYNPVGASSTIPAIQTAGYVDLTGPSQTVTYEVLFSDPFSKETMSVYPVVYYPAGSLPTSVQMDQPQANVTAYASNATFAPWYTTTGNQTNGGQVDGIPRFVKTPTTAPGSPLFSINRCTCSLLFPWVVTSNVYTTGIAVANTSADPTNSALGVFGYTASQQQGTVQLYLFGTTSAGTAQAESNVSNPADVPAAAYPGTDTVAKAGSYATFVINSNFTGYAITQANFQYCHGLAFLFNGTGAAPPISYLGLTLDNGSKLSRTVQLVNDGLVH